MAYITLKSLIGRKKEAADLLAQLVTALGGAVSVTDMEGRLVFGEKPVSTGNALPVRVEEETLGWVSGDEASAAVAVRFLEHLGAKESEKKKLGGEVLNLYREINVIYNFSEKLADVIDPAAIARLTLEEANHVLTGAAGAVLLLDEDEEAFRLIARAGDDQLVPDRLSPGDRLFHMLAGSSQAEIINDLSADLRSEGMNTPIRSLLYAPLKVKHRVIGAIILANAVPANYMAGDLKLLTTLALQSASAIESALLYERTIREAQEREEELRRINMATSRFVPYELIQTLGRQSIVEVQLGDQIEREVTVMFTDIRDYTSLAEEMTPEENFRFLNAFIGRIGPVISSHQGFIIRFLGDGVMSLFLNSAEDAVRAAIGIQRNIEAYNTERQARGWKPVRVGIGLHKGPLIMGIMGNQERMEANLVSDTVNVASRMEGLTKYYGAHLILSDSVLQELRQPDSFHHRFLGDVVVKGKKQITGIYDIYEADPPGMFAKKHQTREMFERGLKAYNERSFEEATAAFAQVLTVHPEDKAAQIYLNNAVKYYSDGVHDNWSAVEKLEFK